MFDKAVRRIVKEVLKESFPCSMTPSIIYAKVLKRKSENNGYSYSLKKVDFFGTEDTSYSIIPNVKSKYNFEPGTIVVVACIEGSSENVYIIGSDNR